MKRKRREERRGEKWFVRAEKTETFSKKVLPLFRGNGCCGSLFTLSRVDSKYLYEARTFTPLCSSYVIERNAVSPPTGCLFFFFFFSFWVLFLYILASPYLSSLLFVTLFTSMERDSRANGARYFYREFPSVGADYSIEKELEILIEMFIPIRKKKKK